MQLKRIFLTLGIVIYLVVLLILWLIRQQQNASWWIPAIAAYVVSLVVLVLWWVPKLQASSLSAKGVDAEAVFKAENDARATLAQIGVAAASVRNYTLAYCAQCSASRT